MFFLVLGLCFYTLCGCGHIICDVFFDFFALRLFALNLLLVLLLFHYLLYLLNVKLEGPLVSFGAGRFPCPSFCDFDGGFGTIVRRLFCVLLFDFEGLEVFGLSLVEFFVLCGVFVNFFFSIFLLYVVFSHLFFVRFCVSGMGA